MRFTTTTRLTLAAFVGCASAAGCTAILGANKDYHEVSAGTGGASTASATSGSSSSSTGSSSSGGGQGGTSSTGSSSSSSGAATCQELKFTCTASPPQGWSYVAFDPSMQSTCPAGFGPATALEEAPTVNGSCTCACGTPMENPCFTSMGQTAQLRFGGSPSCALGGGQQQVPVSALCSSAAFPVPGTYPFAEVLNLKAQQVACSDTATLPPLTGKTGRGCAPNAPDAPGCNVGETCVAPLPSGGLCIQSPGDVPCPVLESTRYVVYAPSDVTDERTCGSCNCHTLFNNSCTGTLTLYSQPGCTGASEVVQATGACAPVTGSGVTQGESYQFDLMPSSTTCQGSTQAPVSGSVKVANAITVCCP